MQLYTYFRSSAAYRVRIALNLKGLAREDVFVRFQTGEQRGEAYRKLNPQGLVPTLVDDGHVLGQSLAILNYLDEVHPEPPLLPRDAAGRARARQLGLIVACDIHPLNNLRVLQYLERQLGLNQEQRNAWYRHWVAQGFAALETLLTTTPGTGTFCQGDSPGFADICLVPQVFNANRFQVDMTPYPTIARIDEACLTLAAFADAAPARQPDAE
jgi:maleylacetoacetate isomerase